MLPGRHGFQCRVFHRPHQHRPFGQPHHRFYFGRNHYDAAFDYVACGVDLHGPVGYGASGQHPGASHKHVQGRHPSGTNWGAAQSLFQTLGETDQFLYSVSCSTGDRVHRRLHPRYKKGRNYCNWIHPAHGSRCITLSWVRPRIFFIEVASV